MSEQHDNERFEHLRAEEDAARRAASDLRADDQVADTDPDAPEPGHLGNDLSKMTLLETDLEAIAKSDDHEPVEGVREAIADLKEINQRLEAQWAEEDATD